MVIDWTVPQLMFVTGRDLLPGADPDGERIQRLVEVIMAAAAGGVSMVQIREKDLPAAQLATVAREVRQALPANVIVIVNGSSAAAEQGGADGLHLPENALGDLESRSGCGLIGRSVHSVEAAVRAVEKGSHYLVAGAIYPTSSHPGQPARGLSFLAEVCRTVSVPVLAIGGITPGNTDACIRAGAAGVAVRSSILQFSDSREMARQYRRALDRFETGK